MKTKYLLILLSLIILILSLSSVSATDSNVDNNSVNDGINNVCLDNNKFISKDSSSLLKEVNSNELNHEQVPILKSNTNSKKGKLKAVINAYYKDRKLPVTVIDKNNKPLKKCKSILESI